MRRFLLLGVLVATFWIGACDEARPPVGGVEVKPATVRLLYPGFSEYRLTWTPTEAIEGELRASIHLIGVDGDVLRTFDHAIGFDWTPGVTETRSQMLYQSALAPPLKEGTYKLRIGLYDASNHWQLTTSGASVQVDASAEGIPAFYFSPEWQPIEGGTDRQVLGRRWLRADGVIRLGELTRPGTLWLQIGVPTPFEGKQDLVLDEGATEPEVVLSSSCTHRTQTFTGSGSHQVMLPVEPGADGVLPAQCEIAIDTNFTLVAVSDGVHRTIALESLSWLGGS